MTVVRGMGTPEYAPPEQYEAESGSTDVRSDIYGLGATLYHALVGQAPPTATKRIVNPAALIPARALNPNIDPAIEAALMRALELRPIDRFQSAREMASALGTGSLYASAPQRATTGPPPPQPRPRKTTPPSRRQSAPINKPPTSPPPQRMQQAQRQQMPQQMPQRLPPQPRPRQERSAASIAAFILGIIGLGSMVIAPLCNLPLPLIGIVVSILGIRSKKQRGLAWAGLMLCLLTIGLTLLLVLIGAVQEFGSF
jgi:serine/threonine protein kinase